MKHKLKVLFVGWGTFFILLVSPLWSQTSTNYILEENTFNSGGDPLNGTVLNSTNYSITLDAVGDGLVGYGLASVSYNSDCGFDSWYPPPQEVINLKFLDTTTLVWDADPATGVYNVYRGLISSLSSGYESCLQGNSQGETYTDSSTYNGEAYFYLITSENRIDEEGSLGFDSSGTERTNTPCP